MQASIDAARTVTSESTVASGHVQHAYLQNLEKWLHIDNIIDTCKPYTDDLFCSAFVQPPRGFT